MLQAILKAFIKLPFVIKIFVLSIFQRQFHTGFTVRHIDRRRPGSLGFKITCASMRETLTLLLVNNKSADQPVHPRSLISAFVIHYLKSQVTRSDIS